MNYSSKCTECGGFIHGYAYVISKIRAEDIYGLVPIRIDDESYCFHPECFCMVAGKKYLTKTDKEQIGYKE